MEVIGSTLVLATRNADKVVEMRNFLDGSHLKILSLVDFSNVPDVEEDGHTVAENAIKKANEIAQATGLTCLADDTGLEVDALNGEPGVRSSRFAGLNASYADNVNYLLERLQGIELTRRSARFRCVMALASRGKIETVEAVCEGVIWPEPRGEQGFGYDPIFYVPQLRKTFAELTLEEKNKMSHRGKALGKIKKLLSTVGENGLQLE